MLEASVAATRGLRGAMHVFSCPVICGSFWTTDRNRVLCTGRLILNRWTTREVLFEIMSFSRKLYAILFAQVFYIYLNINFFHMSLFQKHEYTSDTSKYCCVNKEETVGKGHSVSHRTAVCAL